MEYWSVGEGRQGEEIQIPNFKLLIASIQHRLFDYGILSGTQRARITH